MNTLVVHTPGPLNHCWNSANQIAVFKAIGHGSKPKDGESFIYEVKWGTSMTSDEFMRRLTKSSFECTNDLNEARATYLAAQYDLIQVFELLWHLAELVFIQVSPSDHLAFNLCSWFYLQSLEAANCAREFIEDFNKKQNYSRLRDNMSDDLKSIEKNDRFWPTVLSLVLQARTHEATSLLVLHSNSNSRGLRSLRQLLAAMPIASHVKKESTWNESGALFSQAWNYWQSECDHRLSSSEFDHVGGDQTSMSYVDLIVNILSGRTSIWNDPKILDVTKGPRGWYFRFVSFVFYTDQLVVVEGLGSNLDRWLSLTSDKRTPLSKLDETVDELITSVFRLDLFSFIRISSEKLTNWWLVAHFTNLISRVYPDVLDDFQSDYTNVSNALKKTDLSHTDISMSKLEHKREKRPESLSLTEFFLLGYVETLATETSVLSVALGYLDYCKASGSAYQSALLIRCGIPFSTRATNWFYNQAKLRGLHSTAEHLARLASRRLLPLCLKTGQTNDSPNQWVVPSPSFGLPSCATIGWAFLSHDYSLVNRLAELALDRDCGFMTNVSGDNEDEDDCDVLLSCSKQKPTKQTAESTEVAELAAIILGFSRGGIIASNWNGLPTDANPLLGHLSPELAFLIRYAELQQCFHDGDAQGAVDRLIDLLITNPIGSVNGFVTTINDPHYQTIHSNHLSSSGGTSLRIPTRLRLLLEVRHLFHRGCLRRDQVELLIIALIELRADMECNWAKLAQTMHPLLTNLHISLAKELAATCFSGTNQMDTIGNRVVLPTLS